MKKENYILKHYTLEEKNPQRLKARKLTEREKSFIFIKTEI